MFGFGQKNRSPVVVLLHCAVQDGASFSFDLAHIIEIELVSGLYDRFSGTVVFGIGRCYLQITVFLPEFSPSSPQTAFFSPKPNFTRTPCGIGFFGDFCLRGLKSADFSRVFKLSHCLRKSGVFLQSLNGDSDSKSVVPFGTVGSNPTASAKNRRSPLWWPFIFCETEGKQKPRFSPQVKNGVGSKAATLGRVIESLRLRQK